MRTAAGKAASKKSIAGLHPILNVLKEMNSERNLRRLVTMILDTIIEYSNATRGSLAFFKGDRFNAELSRDKDRNEIRHSEIPTLGAVLMRVNEMGEGIVVDDVREESWIRDGGLLPGYDARAILCLPLRVKARIVGAVYLDNTRISHAFGPRHQELAEILTDHAAIAIENSLLERQSTRDRTTAVANHAHFEQSLDAEMDRARRLSQSCGLLMIDVDDFKQVNDQHGHPAGTEILRRIAYLLSSSLRGLDVVGRPGEQTEGPVVGRYGGDEFEVILPNTSRGGVLDAAARVLMAIRGEPFRIDGKSISVSVTIGGAVYPHDALEMNDLFLRADQALYQAKRAGKGRVALYSDTTPR
ncbi:MAG TPA: sensor domain-containing diguanylate cyclase [Planctomycetota bacterium]|nr:sensor domain-containing diguanylate cyclase [Planctomycetota bacterium]